MIFGGVVTVVSPMILSLNRSIPQCIDIGLDLAGLNIKTRQRAFTFTCNTYIHLFTVGTKQLKM